MTTSIQATHRRLQGRVPSSEDGFDRLTIQPGQFETIHSEKPCAFLEKVNGESIDPREVVAIVESHESFHVRVSRAVKGDDGEFHPDEVIEDSQKGMTHTILIRASHLEEAEILVEEVHEG